jgi:hypothetical protein
MMSIEIQSKTEMSLLSSLPRWLRGQEGRQVLIFSETNLVKKTAKTKLRQGL